MAVPRLYHPIDPFSATGSNLAWMGAAVFVVFGAFYAIGYKFRSYLGHRRRA